MSSIGPFTQEIINTFINEGRKKDTRDKINRYLIDPILQEIRGRFQPYITAFVVVQIIILVLLAYIAIKVT